VLYIVGYCLLLGNQLVKEEEAGQELVRAVPSSSTQEPYHLQVIITFSINYVWLLLTKQKWEKTVEGCMSL
jgi:hypothetical protein